MRSRAELWGLACKGLVPLFVLYENHSQIQGHYSSSLFLLLLSRRLMRASIWYVQETLWGIKPIPLLSWLSGLLSLYHINVNIPSTDTPRSDSSQLVTSSPEGTRTPFCGLTLPFRTTPCPVESGTRTQPRTCQRVTCGTCTRGPPVLMPLLFLGPARTLSESCRILSYPAWSRMCHPCVLS